MYIQRRAWQRLLIHQTNFRQRAVLRFGDDSTYRSVCVEYGSRYMRARRLKYAVRTVCTVKHEAISHYTLHCHIRKVSHTYSAHFRNSIGFLVKDYTTECSSVRGLLRISKGIFLLIPGDDE